MIFAEHDADGRIKAIRTMPDGASPERYTRQGITLAPASLGVSPRTHYVVDGQVVPRPVMDLSIESNRIAGIPGGAVVTIGRQPFEICDGVAEIEGYSGEITVRCWPYVDEVCRI